MNNSIKKSSRRSYAGTELPRVCKKTHSVVKNSVLRKRQGQGARSPKKRNVLCVHEHFLDERNAEIGVFLETLPRLIAELVPPNTRDACGRRSNIGLSL